MQIQLKKTNPDGKIPFQANPLDAGYDLFSLEEYWLKPGERKLFSTGISLTIPKGYYGRIADRSGNAFKLGLHVLAGVIDSTYTGEIKVLLYNTNQGDESQSVKITKDMRIAQIIIEKCESGVEFIEVAQLEDSQRGAGGFGKSGI